ncbi:DUF260 domain-containing protein [Cephalotus follicularis]|uniref:DUF260 domain-containing protein n=1 Tax=Cephalotus follicularis TaxID=3775 RepID=A0A1Q3D9R6_CEPFO|nr:DUF260 domain-containing protein [Cephalotus follicularis]
MSSSNSPCAACKLLRRKCTQECVFAPYFPPDNPQRFANVHKVFGASNVAKILNELSANQREDAVNSLAYEAEARLRDPVYGCVGVISILQHRLTQARAELFNAKKELAAYLGPQAMLPILTTPNFIPPAHMGNPGPSSVMQHGMVPIMGMPTGASHGGQLFIHETQQQQQQQQPHHQQQIFEAQQLAAAVAAREQEMLRSLEQQQQQQKHAQQHQEIVRFNSGYDAAGSVTATGFNQMTNTTMSPSLALGTFDNPYQIQQQQQQEHHHHAHSLQAQLLIQPQQAQPQPQQPQQQNQQQQRAGSEEGRSFGPSC